MLYTNQVIHYTDMHLSAWLQIKFAMRSDDVRFLKAGENHHKRDTRRADLALYWVSIIVVSKI
jgi:hypothetical protein